MFSLNKKRAIENYIEFMDIEDSEIMKNSIGDLSPSFEKIEIEINKMVFDKKGLEEIVELFEDRYKISIEYIKGKYLKGEKLELRNKFIKEVLKYKAINQVELGDSKGLFVMPVKLYALGHFIEKIVIPYILDGAKPFFKNLNLKF